MTWKTDLIHNIFLPMDVDRILNHPLPLVSSPDKFVWFVAKDGQFSVKSAYWFAVSVQPPKLAPASSENTFDIDI